jgi:hypothetical protein
MLRPGMELDGMRTVCRLGADAFAVWYEAKAAEPQAHLQDLLLAVLHPHVAGCDDARAAFVASSTSARDLHDPRFLHVDAMGEHEGAPYRVMRRVRAWTWDELWESTGPFGEEPSAAVHVYVAYQVARAIEAAARSRPAGFVHGALTPRAIGVMVDGSIRIAPPLFDGSGRRRDSSIVHYASPEVLRGGGTSAAADVYALARILRCALNAGSKREGHSAARSTEVESLVGLLSNALGTDPGSRPGIGPFAASLGEMEIVPRGAAALIRMIGASASAPASTLAAPGSQDDPTTAHASVRSSAEAEEAHPRLCVVGGPGARSLPLGGGKARWVVGRSRQADLALDDPDVSREHFEIVRDIAGVFRAFDLGSKNGLLVNGHLADAQRLKAGDELKVGHTTVRFEA